LFRGGHFVIGSVQCQRIELGRIIFKEFGPGLFFGVKKALPFGIIVAAGSCA
jgi:hypothetical protein